MHMQQPSNLLGRLGTVSFLITVAALLAPLTAGAQSEVDDPALLETGGAIYVASCAGCHGVEGEGTAFGRPLIGIADQQPDRLVHIASVTDGKGGMPEFGGSLSEDDIDAAVSYARLTFVAERSVDELPRTGTSPVLFIAAGVLMLTGVALHEWSRRQRSAVSSIVGAP